MKREGFILGLAFLASTLCPAHLDATPPISAAGFTELHTLIKPNQKEAKWAEIPWLTDLWEARTRAAAEGKPILVWSASGEPLGCD